MDQADRELVLAVVDAMSGLFAGIGTTVTDADAARAQVAAQPEIDLPPIELASVADEEIAGVPVRRYRSGTAAGRPIVVFAHGGGWVLCDLDTHDRLCRRLARDLDADVVSVHYRRAPEHRFPAALDDVIAVLRAVAAEHDGPLALAGDSAGGNLAAATTLAARDVPVAAQLLVYPALDARMGTASYEENATGWFLTAETMAWYWGCYLGPGDHAADPLASPVLADDADLAGLPPAVVVTAEHDPLRDEGEAYAARLAAAGVPVELIRAEGLFHGFFSVDELVPPAAPPVTRAIDAFRRLLT